MATKDVPGANPANRDDLRPGAWAEHQDGSLIYVKGTERGTIVYEIYDVAGPDPVSYTDAMKEDAFKKQFSFPPVGTSKVPWTWHDKTEFPWERIMKVLQRPRPTAPFVADQLTAAARVAESLQLRARALDEAEVGPKVSQERHRSAGVLQRLRRAFEALKEG